jgi:hypothetical protein
MNHFKQIFEQILNEGNIKHEINTVRGRIYDYLKAKYNEDRDFDIQKTTEDIVDDFINRKEDEYGKLIEELQDIQSVNDLKKWLDDNKKFSR